MQYVGTGRLGATSNVAYTATAGTATAVNAHTFKVRVLVSTDAFVTTDGTTPSSTNGAYVPALSAEYFTVTPGQSVKAVQVTTAGTLYTVEII